MRDSDTTIYKKGIRLTEEDYAFIDKIKGKKSKAGMLREIIKFYKDNQYANAKLLEMPRE